KTPLMVLKRLTEERHRPVSELNPDIPGWLAAVIDRLLVKDPKARYQTAQEVATELENHWAILRSSSGVAAGLCEKKRKAASRRAILLGTAAALLVVAVAGVAAFFWFPFNRPAPTNQEPASPPSRAVLRGNAGSVWAVAF